jgi:hypothetical protein
MTDGGRVPDEESLSTWLGSLNYKRWIKLRKYIETYYPGVFVPEWLFGGKKHGWGLRYKKSKSFCTLIPERKRFVVLIVFGKKEREKVETILNELSPPVRESYENATTYHDGKWVTLTVDRAEIFNDIKSLLKTKRGTTIKTDA